MKISGCWFLPLRGYVIYSRVVVPSVGAGVQMT